jgi:hypothetical protein
MMLLLRQDKGPGPHPQAEREDEETLLLEDSDDDDGDEGRGGVCCRGLEAVARRLLERQSLLPPRHQPLGGGETGGGGAGAASAAPAPGRQRAVTRLVVRRHRALRRERERCGHGGRGLDEEEEEVRALSEALTRADRARAGEAGRRDAAASARTPPQRSEGRGRTERGSRTRFL